MFSAAFDAVLRVPIQGQIDALVRWIGARSYFAGKYDDAVLDSLHLAGEEPGRAAGFYVEKVIGLKFHQMPERFRPGFAEALLKAEKSFWKQHGGEIEKLIKERQAREATDPIRIEAVKTFLTSNSLKSNNADVKTEIQKLIERVKRKASKPGAKADLARTLHVAPARISEWLNGDKEPGGDYTLKLLNWVEQ